MVVALLAASLLPLALIGAGMYRYASSVLKQRMLTTLRHEAAKDKEALEGFLAERGLELRLVSRALSLSAGTTRPEMAAALAALLSETPSFEGLSVLDVQGQELAHAGRQPLTPDTGRDATWLRDLTVGRFYLSDFREDPQTGRHIVLALRAAHGSQEVILRARLSTEPLARILAQAARDMQGEAFLLDRNGMLQTAARPAIDPRTAAMFTLPQPFEGQRLEEKNGRIYASVWLAEVPWLIVVSVTRDQVLAPMNKIRTIGLFVFILAGILILFTVLLTTNHLVTRLEQKRKSIHFLDHQVRRASQIASSMQLSSASFRDIKDTLANIDVTSQWLGELARGHLSEEQKTGELRQGLDLIRSELSRGRSLIEKALSLTAPSAPRITEVRIDRLLDELLELCHRELHSRNIRVKRHFEEPMPVVQSDPHQLKQVFLNLLANAISAVEHDGEIVLGARRAGDLLEVSVGDSGPGIPAEYMDRIFDPLFTTKADSMGLGLAACLSILEKLGGRISAENLPEKGASFRVEIPVRFTPPGAQ